MTLTAADPTRAVGPARPPAAPAAKDVGAKRWIPRGVVYALLAYWLLVLIPQAETYSAVAADAVIFAIVGLSLNILIGYTGQLSLGHQGFFGVGAFAAAYAATVRGVPFALTFVIAILAGALIALLLGLVALRITGLYLALITLVFGLTLENSLFEVPALTNGGAGQPAERPEWLIGDLSEGRFYLFCLAFLAAAVYLDWRLTRTKVGRALLALKENERVAEAFGVDVTRYKLLAFMLSGALAGLAGALYAYRIGSVSGGDFNFALALTFVLMTVVGGTGNRLGVILGASLFAVLDYLLENTPIRNAEEFFVDLLSGVGLSAGNIEQYDAQYIGALGLLLTLVLNPGGIAQQIRPLTRWLAGKPFSLHGDEDSGPGAVEGSSVRA